MLKGQDPILKNSDKSLNENIISMHWLWKLKVKISIIKHLIAGYHYDAARYLKYATEIDLTKYAEQRLIGYIIAKYHIIEKGLTMPDMRLGFGRQVVESIIESCNVFLNNFGKDNIQVKTAITLLKTYLDVHKKSGYEIDKKLSSEIEKLTYKLKIKDCNDLSSVTTEEIYFNQSESSFQMFAYSRHSLRNFSDKSIPIEKLKQAVELAQSTPTSCNRQPIRIRIVNDKDLMNKILQIQTGNRGFGYMADKLIVICAEISVYNEVRERNMVYVDSGIYAMNLLYSLHYFKIGACALNWGADINEDKKLRDLLKIPGSEIIALIIACGIPAEKFKIAASVRNEGKEITKIY